MITFRIARHSIRPCDIVEVFFGDQLLATVTPSDNGHGIRVFSKYLERVAHYDVMTALLDFRQPPPREGAHEPQRH